MSVSKWLRIAAMALIGLYAAFLIFAADPSYLGVTRPVFILLAIFAAAGIMFLAWKRPLAAGLLVLFLAVLFFVDGARNSMEIYGANSGGFIVLMIVLSSPLWLAGGLLVAAQRAMR